VEGAPLPGYIPALAEPPPGRPEDGGGATGSSGPRSGGLSDCGIRSVGRRREKEKLMLRVVRPAVFNALSRVYSGGVGGGGRRPLSAQANSQAAMAGASHVHDDESEGSDSSWDSDIDE